MNEDQVIIEEPTAKDIFDGIVSDNEDRYQVVADDPALDDDTRADLIRALEGIEEQAKEALELIKKSSGDE
jgi:hypothetical protein